MKERVREILEERIRPQLALHNGSLELLDVRDQTVYIRLLGQCAHCPASYLTTEQLIYMELTEALPGKIKAVSVEQTVSESLLKQARQLLGKQYENH
ncbi:NifU family protein [uncultured Oscillibacter sp.]|uniref:NifU family protein n=1 Tax=uncultured Oscillibacter sp. TaxID=876091 RepID=UPI00260AE585|nr:NifU family protein [uncultured Oscillibacter sp.]